jgi:hypothetical protein
MVCNMTRAQTFSYIESDLCLGFRKVSPYTENNEVVVNIGQAKNFVDLAIGNTVTVGGFSAAQLSPGSFASLNNLSWSVIGWYAGPNANYAGYPAYTLWLTVPRTNASVRSADAPRLSFSEQSVLTSPMASILDNAAFISSDIGSVGPYNSATFVRESIATYPTHILSVWMSSVVDNRVGTLNDNWANNLEVATPSSFSGTVRNDLYEVRPLDNGHGGQVTDPHTGTSGIAYYVGYFELKSDGTMTFTREAATTTPPSAPPAPSLSVSFSGTTATISFGTTNGATYTLHYTNSAALNTPVSSWPTLPTTVTGDGGSKSFTDNSTDSDRVYRVGAQ